MQPVSLSKNEKLVLYGLVRYPEYNDIQVSEQLGVKRPTVTKIKNKLREMKLYRALNVPNYFAVGGGVGLLCHNVIHASPQKKLMEKGMEVLRALNKASVLHIRSNRECIDLSMFADFNHLQRTIDSIDGEFMALDLLRSYTAYTYALALTKFPVYFDAAYLVNRAYDMGRDDILMGGLPNPPGPQRFSAKERAILEALVRYPEATDTFIADELDVARPTVSEKRGTFYAEGTLKRVNLPNMAMLGYEMLGFFRIPYSSKLDASTGVDTLEIMRELFHPILLVSRPVECVGLFAVKNYAEYRQCIDDLAERRDRSSNVGIEPFFTAISYSNLTGIHIDLAGPLQGILNSSEI